MLARADRAVGMVTAIAGMEGYVVEFAGEAGHAGTVPMAGRADAFAAAAAFSLALYEAARALPGAVATIGTVRLSNPATNIVPGRVRLSADVRAPDAAGAGLAVRRGRAARGARGRARRLHRDGDRHRRRPADADVLARAGRDLGRRRRARACRSPSCRAAPGTTPRSSRARASSRG